MNPFNYFCHAQKLGHSPALLEFTHPQQRTPFSVCGINPHATLMVREGKLYRDNLIIGTALDIFDALHLAESSTFFPAWIGFFSYEFSGYFGNATHGGTRTFPDAFFQFFDQGLVLDNGVVLHHDELSSEAGSSTLSRLETKSLLPPIAEDQFTNVVDAIKQRIRKGDVYQVNFSLPFSFHAHDHEMLAIYAAMRTNNQSPFMGIMHTDDWWLLSGSPERLFSRVLGTLTARPIAGTKPRRLDKALDDKEIESLTTCPKENAEHAMLVDLMRNDLNQVCEPGTVRIDEDRSVEFYSHVMHLVSEISGTSSASLRDIFSAIFPGGTITGAPKGMVMKAIAELEAYPRGPYTGSFGYLSGMGIDFNILIRSVFKHGDEAIINAGAGIVIDSHPPSEWLEIKRKAQAVKDILEHKSSQKPKRDVITGPAHRPITREPINHTRVIFVENHDSFSFNIVDAMRSLGAHVDVRTLCADMHFEDATHVVLGPGPGNPEMMPELARAIESALSLKIPLLGICLGHQAIGHYFGARVKRLPMPVHGKPHEVFHFDRGLFAGLASPLTFVRYHSLVIDETPKNFMVEAYTRDDCIMAIRHTSLPIFGVQFHPESYLSHGGATLLGNFLRSQRIF